MKKKLEHSYKIILFYTVTAQAINTQLKCTSQVHLNIPNRHNNLYNRPAIGTKKTYISGVKHKTGSNLNLPNFCTILVLFSTTNLDCWAVNEITI